jgi:hypothetical protein
MSTIQTNEHSLQSGSQGAEVQQTRSALPLAGEGFHALYTDMMEGKIMDYNVEQSAQAADARRDVFEESWTKRVIDARKEREPGYMGDKANGISTGTMAKNRALLSGHNKALYDRFGFGRTDRVLQAILSFMWVSACTGLVITNSTFRTSRRTKGGVRDDTRSEL